MTPHTSDCVSRALSPMPPLHGGHNSVTHYPTNFYPTSLPDNGTPAPYCSTTSASDLRKKNTHAYMPHNAYIMIFHLYHFQKKKSF